MMKKLLSGISLVALFCGVSNVNAQGTYQGQFNCGHEHARAKLIQQHPEILQQEEDYNRELEAILSNPSENRDEQVYIIPVVFHVIHNNGSENISDEQIFDQMAILNRDYRLLNADTAQIIEEFAGLKADVRIEFRLAQLDPWGNCTNGIDRIQSMETYVGDDGSKLNPWYRDRYLNVWTVADMEGGVAGYAYQPASVLGGFQSLIDGIIIRHNYIGSIGTSDPFSSRALTHEIGHWLNLAHPWGNTNSPEVGCGDDFVLDTPETAGHLSCTDRYDYHCDSLGFTSTANTINYAFGGVTTSSGNIDPTNPPTFTDGDVVFTPMSASGVSGNATTAGQFAFSGFDAGAANGETVYNNLSGNPINLGKYYEFTISPEFGQGMNFSALTFKVSRDSMGCRTFAVRSSINNFGSNIVCSVTPANPLLGAQVGNVMFIKQDSAAVFAGTKITLSGASYTNVRESVTFRIYGWNAEDAAGSFGIDDLAVVGSYGTIENVENYMEYSYCSKMFTLGQKARMRAAVESSLASRSTLWSASNLALTGVDEASSPCAPIADFYPSAQFACTNTGITFYPNVQNATATNFSWTFQDGTPATSTNASETVSFSSSGWKSVTLTVGNSVGSDTKTITQSVYIGSDASEFNTTTGEGFETLSDLNGTWYSSNLNNNNTSFQIVNTAAATGTHCVKLNAYEHVTDQFNTGDNDVDVLYSPIIDLTGVSVPGISFKYAYATAGVAIADISEKLEVWVSRDCGKSWGLSPRWMKDSLDLVTASNHTTAFTPTLASEWSHEVIALPAATFATDHIKVKFVYKSTDASNNLYIDDIQINGTVGIEEFSNLNGVSVYPNPIADNSIIAYNLNSDSDVHIALYDMSGRQIQVLANNRQTQGEYKIPVSLNGVAKGAYMLKLTTGSAVNVTKVIVK